MRKIITGGQTGADRAALDVAAELRIPRGGWCPRDGWAEDLSAPPGLLAAYPELLETPSGSPAQQTRWNVRDSDATLVEAVRGWLRGLGPEVVLNVAGPAESTSPSSYDRTHRLLEQLLD